MRRFCRRKSASLERRMMLVVCPPRSLGQDKGALLRDRRRCRRPLQLRRLHLLHLLLLLRHHRHHHPHHLQLFRRWHMVTIGGSGVVCWCSYAREDCRPMSLLLVFFSHLRSTHWHPQLRSPCRHGNTKVPPFRRSRQFRGIRGAQMHRNPSLRFSQQHLRNSNPLALFLQVRSLLAGLCFSMVLHSSRRGNARPRLTDSVPKLTPPPTSSLSPSTAALTPSPVVNGNASDAEVAVAAKLPSSSSSSSSSSSPPLSSSSSSASSVSHSVTSHATKSKGAWV